MARARSGMGREGARLRGRCSRARALTQASSSRSAATGSRHQVPGRRRIDRGPAEQRARQDPQGRTSRAGPAHGPQQTSELREGILDVGVRGRDSERRGHAAWITINRDKRGNSFRRETLDEITRRARARRRCAQRPQRGDHGRGQPVLFDRRRRRRLQDPLQRRHGRHEGVRARDGENVLRDHPLPEADDPPHQRRLRWRGECLPSRGRLRRDEPHAKFQQVGDHDRQRGGFGPTQWWPLMVGDSRARDILMCSSRSAPNSRCSGARPTLSRLRPARCRGAGLRREAGARFPDALRYTKVTVNAPEGACRSAR